MCIYIRREMSVRKIFSFITNCIWTNSPTRLASKNKPTRVNERETTKWRRRFSLSTISRGCKTHLPPLFPFRWAMRGVVSILSLRSHAVSIPLFVPSPPPPPRWHPRCSTPPLETRPSPRVEHVLLYSPLLSEVVRYRPRRVHRGLRFICRVPRCA